MHEKERKRTTLGDVAERAGVSVATVSKALNERGGVSAAIRKRVLRAAEDSGYQRSSQRILLNMEVGRVTLVTVSDWACDYFYGEICTGFVKECRRIGIETETLLVPPNAATNLTVFKDLIEKSDIECIALMGIDGPEILEYVSSGQIPAVLINGIDRHMTINSVAPDYRHGAWLATQHLLEHGHRDIVHLTHGYRESIRRKVDGFRDALEQSGIEFDRTKHVIDTGQHDNTFGARDAIDAVLKRGPLPFTAIFCVTDLAAISVIQTVQSAGYRVPRDVSVIGFDDQPICTLQQPALSTVRVEVSDLGRTGLYVMLEALGNPTRKISRTEISVELVPRGTVATIDH
jgi:DNA-binding LacI/PurR family transcriptional regulator